MLDDNLEDLGSRIQDLSIRSRERQEAWEAEFGPRNRWMRNEADEIFTMDGLECWIIKSAMWQEYNEGRRRTAQNGRMRAWARKTIFPMCGYCGYVVFPEKPLVEPEYHGIVEYIPVHGGVTYAHHDAFGSVYGFDTAHHGSEKLPIRDKEWIRGQIDILARGLLLAASIEEEYLKADGDNHRRAELVQPILDLQPGPLNFGVMINMLTGQL